MKKLSIKNLMKKNKKNGFTLVELIIVIAIIAILAAIAIPKFGAIRKNANIKADIATAKTIHSLAAEYIANGHDDVTFENVKDQLDGKDTTKTKTTGNEFAVEYDDKTGNIVVKDSGKTTGEGQNAKTEGNVEIYPNPDGDYDTSKDATTN